MAKSKRPSSMKHPLAFGSLRNWLKLLWANGGVENEFLLRAGFLSAGSVLTAPLRFYERAAYRRAIENASVNDPPVFIIGHWRSGTTPLHQLLCRDPAMGYVSTFQTIAPEWFLTGEKYLKGLIAAMVPSKRMMDNMGLTLDDPQEEEFSVAEISPCSFYHQWSFPRKGREYFEKYVLFENIADAAIDRWKTLYTDVLKKAAYRHEGRRLIVKNPINSARIEILGELFPGAKFIHIYRNPFIVFLSTRHFFKSVLSITQLQKIDDEELDENIFWYYKQLMQKYLADKYMIPPDNLVEIRFEDFETNPLGEVRRIYDQLGLPSYTAAESEFCDCLESRRDYKKNIYEIDADTVSKVKEHWGFAVDHWNYEPPAG